MGVKSKTASEYQRSFKSKYPCFTTTYENNVNYRQCRRSREHGHQLEPFDWDLQSETSSENGSSCLDQKPKHPNTCGVPKHIYKHEKFNKAYRDRLNQLTQDLSQHLHIGGTPGDRVDVVPAKQSRDTEAQTDKVLQVDKAVNGSVAISQETFGDHPNGEVVPDAVAANANMLKKHERSPKKSSPAKPRHPHHVARPRPVTAPPKQEIVPKSAMNPNETITIDGQKSEGKPKAPFVSYGSCNQDFPTGQQKTYNVRASAEIYPSALLAQKRRKAQTSKHRRSVQSAAGRQQRKRAYFNEFNERTKRETSQWDTEYRQHFAGYETEVYERCLSARPPSKVHDPQLMLSTI